MRGLPFAEFWPLYLRAHRRRATRAAHHAGIISGILGTTLAVSTLEVWPFLVGVGAAFGLSVGSHRLFEGNRPLLGRNPAWAALCDLRMFYLAMTGGLRREMARHGLDEEQAGWPAALTASPRSPGERRGGPAANARPRGRRSA